MNQGKSPILTARKLSLYYQGSDKPALKNINLEIKKGEYILITGASGSGKTSLLHSLGGLIPRSIRGRVTGVVSLFDKDIQNFPSWEISKYLAIIFQEPENQFFTLKVKDELAFGPENHGIPPEKIQSKIDKIADHTGLGPLLPRTLYALSEGEKQKVAIASNLTLDPKILLFDEPTSNLDEKSTKDFYSFLNTLRHQGDYTIILIEHRLRFPSQIIDKLIVLCNGEISYIGEPPLLKDKNSLKKWGIMEAIDETVIGDDFWRISNNDDHNKSLISLSNVHFQFKNREDFILKIPRFTIKPGEAIAILGANGTGKTTLLRLIAGLLKPSSGTILFKGKKIHHISKRKRCRLICLVLQNSDHQLFMPDVLSEMSYANDLNLANLLLSQFNLSHLKDRHPHSLSVGEKQRLTIASALIYQPSVLLLDEPTSGMDSVNINLLIKLLKEYKNAGMAIFIASHNIKLICAICDRGIKISDC